MYKKTSSPQINHAFTADESSNEKEMNNFITDATLTCDRNDVVMNIADLANGASKHQYETENCEKYETEAPELNGKIKYGEIDKENKNILQGFNLLEILKHRFQLWIEHNSKRLRIFIWAISLIIYNVYLSYAISLTWVQCDTYCDGVKFLVLITGFVYICAFYKIIFKPFMLDYILQCIEVANRHFTLKHRDKILWSIVWTCVVTFLIVDSKDNWNRLYSAAGLVVLLFLGYLFSAHPKKVIWRHVQWGVLIQFIFGLFILRWDVGQDVFQCLGEKIKTFLEFSDKGSAFVFGYLVTGELTDLPIQPAVFAFKILTTILYFSFIVSILYYYGWMQVMVSNVGGLLQATVGTTACESMNAAGNIFLGMTECPMLIRPYLPLMTKSELHAVLTGGFATIAGSVMAAYISFGVNASHLLSASVMSAPAALAYSKLMYPESEESATKAEDITFEKPTENNALEAGVNGTCASVKLVSNVAANLIAFVAIIAFLDSVFSWFGTLINWNFLSFEWLLSKLFIPLALIMGVDWDDKEKVAQLVGLKTTVNEFVAYGKLSEFTKAKALSLRSEAIATFALCGFSNIASIGIQVACLSAMAPDRKSDIAQIAGRAMIAGSAACFMTACVAGTLIRTPAS